ncbi:hypothetical protein ABPG75_006695 [Micractinium tetrahymenae]
MLQPNPEARPTAADILERHGTPERLARLPRPPAENACGQAWEEAQGAELLPAIRLPSGPQLDLQQLGARLPRPCAAAAAQAQAHAAATAAATGAAVIVAEE